MPLHVILNTNDDWYRYIESLARSGALGHGAQDEVNFWFMKEQRVRGQQYVLNQTRVYLRITRDGRRPVRAVAGWARFCGYQRMSIHEAWKRFDERNGFPTLAAFEDALRRARRNTRLTMADPLGCMIVQDVHLWPAGRWWPVEFGNGIVIERPADEAEIEILETAIANDGVDNGRGWP